MSTNNPKNIGNDAAYMLEKALEEMDDIFRDSSEGNGNTMFNTTTITTSMDLNNGLASAKQLKFNEHVEKFKILLNELEVYLKWQLSENQHAFHYEKQAVLSFCKSLLYVPQFFQDLKTFESTASTTITSDLEKRLNQVKLERDNFELETRLLKEDKLRLEENVLKTKKDLSEYARKNEELMMRMREQRISNQHIDQVSYKEEEEIEMERLKLHIDTLLLEQERNNNKPQGFIEDSSVGGLKSRLRDKASECNRLKLQLEDMKQMQEAKDVTIMTIQDQIQRLFEENEMLRKQLSTVSMSNNNSIHATMFSKCTGLQPESASGSSGVRMNQIKGLKCASEPSLSPNEFRGGAPLSILSSSFVTEDEYWYQPWRRVISEAPFTTWSLDQVQDWMREEDLEEFVPACGNCGVTKGEDIMKFTNADFELKLGITDSIVKKKLSLALKGVTSRELDYPGRLDSTWVIHWLDDLGLPQYKQSFFEHKIDGRVLVEMTLDDILTAKVYNLLHHASLKRAIQFLKHQRFHPQYLREIANQSEERCDHVMLWTNHRIMHWLRSVDLAEYAPNLRGSGVHGALMVLEPRFNAETLANLLSIPDNKTLLRRHVATQFATLLGEACQKQKDIMMKTSDFTPLNGSEKHKLRKKGFTSLTRKRKSELDLNELVCPKEQDVSSMYSPPPALDPEVLFDPPETSSLSPSLIHDFVSESTTNDASNGPKISVLSDDIGCSMTSMI